MSRASQHPTERDRPGLHMALAALERRQNIYPGADSIPRLLLEQIGNEGAVQEQSYDALLAERDQLRAELEHREILLEETRLAWDMALKASEHLRAEPEAIRGQQPVAWASPDVAGGVRWSPGAFQQLSDGSPLYALPPLQPDAWPTLDKPAKVGPVRFHAGLSARLVVEAAQRQHEYSQQPEVEAARLERLQSAMREFHGEQPDAVSVPRELLERLDSFYTSLDDIEAWSELRALLHAK